MTVTHEQHLWTADDDPNALHLRLQRNYLGPIEGRIYTIVIDDHVAAQTSHADRRWLKAELDSGRHGRWANFWAADTGVTTWSTLDPRAATLITALARNEVPRLRALLELTDIEDTAA